MVEIFSNLISLIGHIYTLVQLLLLKQKEKITINISENHLDIKQNQSCLITRIIKESFPDFNSVIPEELNIKASLNGQTVEKQIEFSLYP